MSIKNCFKQLKMQREEDRLRAQEYAIAIKRLLKKGVFTEAVSAVNHNAKTEFIKICEKGRISEDIGNKIWYMVKSEHARVQW
jgi:hypothetical protein